MIPANGSSFGRAGGRLRRYPGGTENASILATVRGSIPNCRAASRRLRPSICTAYRTRPYSSTTFIPRPRPLRQRATCCRNFTPAQPDRPAASIRDFCSGAYTVSRRVQAERDALPIGVAYLPLTAVPLRDHPIKLERFAGIEVPRILPQMLTQEFAPQRAD